MAEQGGRKRVRPAPEGEEGVMASVMDTVRNWHRALHAAVGWRVLRGNAQEGLSARTNVLAQQDAMTKVMGILGEGHHLFVAGVCRDWRRLYSAAHPALTTRLRSVVGSVECVEWVIKGPMQGGRLLSCNTMVAAVRWGDVSICQALHLVWPWDFLRCTECVCQMAARNAKHGLSILKWLRSEDRPAKQGLLKRICSTALPAGKRPCPWDAMTCYEAAWRGDMGMLAWLLSDEANSPFDHTVWEGAVQGGHISVLEMLLAHPKVSPELEKAEDEEGSEAAGSDDGSKWRFGAYCAAREGQLEVLRWLHANARDLCHWDGGVCFNAVCGGSLATLQWLRSERVLCGWDRFSCPEQILRMDFGDIERGGAFEEIKRWVHANGHPCDCED